ncbi:MAG TPA: PilT/PilU family type 4a pilus ATPase [Polyangiaceae bacterium]|nr:PilT/PilU family type 4a pilus ATPase [Polyangiaceae bacterium]
MADTEPSKTASPFASERFFLQLLAKAVGGGGRDVHLKVGQPPGARVRGELVYFRMERITPADTIAIARHVINDAAVLANLGKLREYDASFEAEGIGRFRVNVYRQKGSLATVLRFIPMKVPTLDELGAPQACYDLALKERGLVLCVGAAGNGKSSTLAAMIDHMNENMAHHIVTIEDPIEFVHTDKRSSVSQREIGLDTENFASALRASLRQDPDVIQVGEIRDFETMEIALKAAETGHLVLSTLHTPDVSRTMNRIISLAEGNADELRERLGDALQGIIAQRLLPRADGNGMVLVAEVLVASGSVRESIKRPQGNPSLKELMDNGEHPYGMQTFEKHVRALVREGVVDRDVARAALGF